VQPCPCGSVEPRTRVRRPSLWVTQRARSLVATASSSAECCTDTHRPDRYRKARKPSSTESEPCFSSPSEFPLFGFGIFKTSDGHRNNVFL
jgi:hypothetical protein